MHRILTLAIGAYELARMAASCGFRLRKPYWRWRYETAFGNDAFARIPRAARWRAMLEYGAWANRMRRRFN